MSESSPSAYDFMIEEYRQIVKVYDDLHTQKNDLLKFYITIIGGGASVVTLLSQITQGQNIFSFHSLPVDSPTAIGLLALLLFVVGLIIFLSLVGLRIEMVLYIRTINALRGFFVEKDRREHKDFLIEDFLVLPSYDEKTPPFRESYLTSFFWTLILMGVVDSALLVSGLYMLQFEISFLFFLFFVWIAAHYLIYCIIASHMEKEYNVKRKRPKNKKEWGTIITE